MPNETNEPKDNENKAPENTEDKKPDLPAPGDNPPFPEGGSEPDPI